MQAATVIFNTKYKVTIYLKNFAHAYRRAKALLNIISPQ